MGIMGLQWQWQWAGAVAVVFMAASYLVKSYQVMRMLAFAGLLAGGISFLIVPGEPVWAGVAALVGLATVNLVQWVQGWRRVKVVNLSGQERALREWLFPSLGDAEFQQLLQVSLRSYPVAGTFLVTQGEKLEQLYVIIQGTAHVVANGMVVASLRDGSLVGEVSFFRDDVATASVVAQTDLSVLSISRPQLRKLMRDSDGLQRALNESIGRDLGFKLTSFDASRF